MLEPLLTKSHCAACKKCCTFEAMELQDAPLFTSETREIVLRDIDPTAGFIPRGNMWQIELRRISGTDKYVCPVLDSAEGCRLGNQRPFDCRSFPFYVMRQGEEVVLALSPICPVITESERVAIDRVLDSGLLTSLIEEALTCPDTIADYRPELLLLRKIGLLYELLNKNHAS
jgi:hypothetical protein